jgi:NADH-quinone oxidoreductase subunit D
MTEIKELNIPLGPMHNLQELAASGDSLGERLTLQMGPQHPATHGVLRLELETDGEIVTKVTPYIGYLHRCFEKISEKISWPQIVPYTDRMDYLAAMNMELGYVLAVEKIMGIEVNERVKTIRVMVNELNRIGSHLLALATNSLDIGAWTPFLLLFQEREHILDLLEELSGGRLLYNYIWIGGLSYDLPDGWTNKVREFCDYIEPKFKELNDLLSYNKIFIERNANVGVMTPEIAVAYGVTGPNLRACGVKWDLRKNEPYSGYENYDFDVPVGTDEVGVPGDCWNRYMVRIREMGQAVKIIRQTIDRLPEGDVKEKIPRNFNKIPTGDCYVRTEAPRGELGFYIVSDGTKNPYRVKARSGAFTAVSSLPAFATGILIGDMVAIIASIDIVLGEVDR